MQAQFLRLDAKPWRDHIQVQIQADGFGVDGDAALFIIIGEAHIRLNGQMWLTLEIEAVADYIGSRFIIDLVSGPLTTFCS